MKKIIKIQAIIALLSMLWASSVAADASQQMVRDSAPTTYTVKSGDTLWDIAGKFLDEPYHWPKIWQQNPGLEDPNLIYPGDVILLEYVQGKPVLRLERKHKALGSDWDAQSNTLKLHPRIRKLPADKAIPTIPLHVIGPFLNDSRVITEEEITASGKIVALDEDHLVVGSGDRIFVSGAKRGMKNSIYAIIRPGKKYKDPKSSASLGMEGLILGKAKQEISGEPASFIVNQSTVEIKVGDRVLPTENQPVNPYFIPKEPEGNVNGKIISVFGGVNQIGQYQVVVITGGMDQNRQLGDVLAVTQQQKDLPSRFLAEDKNKPLNFPSIKVGKLVVFRVFDKVSYALVMKALRPIYLLDDVTKP